MSSDASVFVGLDCGGSSTRLLALSASGATLHEGSAGSANLATTHPEILLKALQKAANGCPPASVVCGCFAGLLTEDDRARACACLTEVFPGALVRAEPDYAAAFESAESAIDVCVVSGTGSLICSRGENGWIRSGGGGYLLGDAGSAFDVGRRALKLWLSQDSPAPVPLAKAVEEVFGSQASNEVIANLYASASPPAKLARLAPSVAKLAAGGETFAEEVLSGAMEQLCCEVVRHVSRHIPGAGTVRFGLAGGFWQASSMVQRVFDTALRRTIIRDYVIERIRRPPVRGAVALAMELSLGN